MNVAVITGHSCVSGDARVPARIGNHGLEWLWRFAQEPKKLWRRDIIDGPKFRGHVLMEMTGIRKYD